MDDVIFILRPKVIRYAQLADLSSTRFDQNHRKKQFDQLQEWRRSDVIDQEIRRWLSDQNGQDRKGRSVAVLSTQTSEHAASGITASTVVRMTSAWPSWIRESTEVIRILKSEWRCHTG